MAIIKSLAFIVAEWRGIVNLTQKVGIWGHL